MPMKSNGSPATQNEMNSSKNLYSVPKETRLSYSTMSNYRESPSRLSSKQKQRIDLYISSMEKRKQKRENIFVRLWTLSKMQYSLLVTGLRVLVLTLLTSTILFLLLPLSLLLDFYRALVAAYVIQRRKKR